MSSRDRIRPPDAKAGKHLKAPSTDTTGSKNKDHPIFCLHHLQNLAACETEEKAGLASTLATLAKMSWQQIQQADRRKLGHEQIPIKQLSGVQLPQFVQGQYDYVLVFRLTRKGRLLGVREGETLRLVYIDPDHVIY